MVYIREAHPTDGWQLPSNLEEGVLVRQARSYDERLGAADACAVSLKLSIPTLVDGIDNAADLAFNAWPERLIVLDTDARIVYQGGKGPYGFDPEGLAGFLESLLISPSPAAS